MISEKIFISNRTLSVPYSIRIRNREIPIPYLYLHTIRSDSVSEKIRIRIWFHYYSTVSAPFSPLLGTGCASFIFVTLPGLYASAHVLMALVIFLIVVFRGATAEIRFVALQLRAWLVLWIKQYRTRFLVSVSRWVW